MLPVQGREGRQREFIVDASWLGIKTLRRRIARRAPIRASVSMDVSEIFDDVDSDIEKNKEHSTKNYIIDPVRNKQLFQAELNESEWDQTFWDDAVEEWNAMH